MYLSFILTLLVNKRVQTLILGLKSVMYFASRLEISKTKKNKMLVKFKNHTHLLFYLLYDVILLKYLMLPVSFLHILAPPNIMLSE